MTAPSPGSPSENKALMKQQLKARLQELQEEYRKGQARLQEVEEEAAQLKNMLLRISGAIQVLEEELGKGEE